MKQTLWRICPLQVRSTACGYYVMKYMREIVNRGSIVISNSQNECPRPVFQGCIQVPIELSA
uniref:Uncharacterized protein n=1 Tax=Cucumis melo TaxID=3656 RepID=A0A9I9E4U0_CUCME